MTADPRRVEVPVAVSEPRADRFTSGSETQSKTDSYDRRPPARPRRTRLREQQQHKVKAQFRIALVRVGRPVWRWRRGLRGALRWFCCRLAVMKAASQLCSHILKLAKGYLAKKGAFFLFARVHTNKQVCTLGRRHGGVGQTAKYSHSSQVQTGRWQRWSDRHVSGFQLLIRWIDDVLINSSKLWRTWGSYKGMVSLAYVA